MLHMMVNIIVQLVVNMVVIGNKYDGLLINILVVNMVVSSSNNIFEFINNPSCLCKYLSPMYLYINQLYDRCVVGGEYTTYSSFNNLRLFPQTLGHCFITICRHFSIRNVALPQWVLFWDLTIWMKYVYKIYEKKTNTRNIQNWKDTKPLQLIHINITCIYNASETKQFS